MKKRQVPNINIIAKEGQKDKIITGSKSKMLLEAKRAKQISNDNSSYKELY